MLCYDQSCYEILVRWYSIDELVPSLWMSRHIRIWTFPPGPCGPPGCRGRLQVIGHCPSLLSQVTSPVSVQAYGSQSSVYWYMSMSFWILLVQPTTNHLPSTLKRFWIPWPSSLASWAPAKQCSPPSASPTWRLLGFHGQPQWCPIPIGSDPGLQNVIQEPPKDSQMEVSDSQHEEGRPRNKTSMPASRNQESGAGGRGRSVQDIYIYIYIKYEYICIYL